MLNNIKATSKIVKNISKQAIKISSKISSVEANKALKNLQMI